MERKAQRDSLAPSASLFLSLPFARPPRSPSQVVDAFNSTSCMLLRLVFFPLKTPYSLVQSRSEGVDIRGSICDCRDRDSDHSEQSRPAQGALPYVSQILMGRPRRSLLSQADPPASPSATVQHQRQCRVINRPVGSIDLAPPTQCLRAPSRSRAFHLSRIAGPASSSICCVTGLCMLSMTFSTTVI